MFLTDALLALCYPQSCRICGASVEQHRFGIACERCWNDISTDEDWNDISTNEKWIGGNRSVGFYEGALRETVLLLKRQPFLPQHLVELLWEASKSLAGVTRVVPVPLHEERLRSRGFNQAAVIGRELSRALHVPMDETSLVRVSSAEKHRTGLDARGRRDSVAKAFRVCYPRLVDGEHILLIDDVFTTGATVEACATVLNEAGAKSVSIMTLARVRH